MGQTLVDVILNGTDENPYHRHGLTQNPFPQLATYERAAASMALQSLAGDPIPHDRAADYIRERLEKHWSEEFIQRVVGAFQPGLRVHLRVTLSWPD